MAAFLATYHCRSVLQHSSNARFYFIGLVALMSSPALSSPLSSDRRRKSDQRAPRCPPTLRGSSACFPPAPAPPSPVVHCHLNGHQFPAGCCSTKFEGGSVTLYGMETERGWLFS